MEFVKSHLSLRTGLRARRSAEEKERAPPASVSCTEVAGGVGPLSSHIFFIIRNQKVIMKVFIVLAAAAALVSKYKISIFYIL